MKDNAHETYHDYEQELIGIAEQESHDAGECKGPPRCVPCLDEQERGEESLGG